MIRYNFEKCNNNVIEINFANLFNRALYNNGNAVIFCPSMSVIENINKHIIDNLLDNGIQCLLITDNKPRYLELCKKHNGTHVDFRNDNHINLFDIKLDPFDAVSCEVFDSSLYTRAWSKADEILSFISISIPDLTNSECKIIDDAVSKIYENYGITNDFKSLCVAPDDKSKGLKEMPIFEDLYNELKDKQIRSEILNLLSRCSEGNLNWFNARTNIDDSNNLIMLDLSTLSNIDLETHLFYTLNYVLSIIRKDVTHREVIFFDLDYSILFKEKAAEYIKWFFKIARGYNAGTFLSTQSFERLFSSDGRRLGDSVLKNSSMQLLFPVDQSEHNLAQEKFNLTSDEALLFRSFNPYDCFINLKQI